MTLLDPEVQPHTATTGAADRPRVAIVIPVWNKAPVTLRCLEAIAATTPDDLYEVVVVDNASTDGTADLLASLEGDVVVVSNPTNLGYTLASNQGCLASDAELVCFLNNDTEPQPGWLDALVRCLDEHPECGVVGARLVYPDGRLQEAGGIVFADGSGWNFGRFDDPAAPAYADGCEVDYCSGAALLVRRAVLDANGGGYDPAFAPGYYEDTDLCFAARAQGWTVRYEPRSTVVHHEGISSGTDLAAGMKAHQVRNQGAFARRWASVLASHEIAPSLGGLVPVTQDRAQRPVGLPRRRTGTRRTGPQRVLVVDPFLPLWDRASGSLRTLRIVESMVDAGHAVTYLARNGAGQERYADHLRGLGVAVVASDPHRLAQLGASVDAPPIDLPALLRSSTFDVAWLDFHEVGRQYLPLLRRWSPGTTVWIDTVDVHFRRLAAEAELRGDRALAARADLERDLERWTYDLADGLVAVTDEDAAILGSLNPGALVHVVPNVHEVVDPPVSLLGRRGMVFVGNPAHPPNVDAAIWLASDVVPAVRRLVPGATCAIVGGPVHPDVQAAVERSPGCHALGWVPETAPVLDAARVSVAPLRFGAGMKGKVGEALGRGLPVVGTPTALEGMHLSEGAGTLEGTSVDELAAAIASLLTDDERWSRCSAGAVAAVRERWSAAAVAPRVADVLST